MRKTCGSRGPHKLALAALALAGWGCGEARPRAAAPRIASVRSISLGEPPAFTEAGPANDGSDGGMVETLAPSAEIDPLGHASSKVSAPRASASDRSPAAPSGENGACPEGMLLVETEYCPVIDRTCIDSEYNAPNHITICHKFAERQRCIGKRQHRRFCIDEYEYPNQKGAHPPWMVSWYDAQATCGSVGKRLCLESEWVAACEGPRETPFPYGWERDNKKCNVDNVWIEPSLREVYTKDRFVQIQELSRLDQSVPSGALSECVSGFGVRDMTGNFDEWVTADERHDDRSEWAGLKGGAWGHVRNACRPVTTSHPPDFAYYFISFRCCKDPEGDPRADQIPEYSPRSDPPPVPPADRAPETEAIYPAGPSRIKVGRNVPSTPKK